MSNGVSKNAFFFQSRNKAFLGGNLLAPKIRHLCFVDVSHQKLKDAFDWLSLSKCPSKDGKVLRRFLPRKKAGCLRRRRSFSSKMSLDESVRWPRMEQFEIQAFGGKTVSSSYHVQTCKDLERRTWRTCQVD